ncbi:hypothetical protein Dimus_037602, partial [Dionaea muscipula]
MARVHPNGFLGPFGKNSYANESRMRATSGNPPLAKPIGRATLGIRTLGSLRGSSSFLETKRKM